MTMAASTLHMTVSFVRKYFILESLYKQMLSTYDMHGMKMRHATRQPCRFVMTMRTIHFGLVRGTISGGYNMQESTNWTQTSIHACIGGG